MVHIPHDIVMNARARVLVSSATSMVVRVTEEAAEEWAEQQDYTKAELVSFANEHLLEVENTQGRSRSDVRLMLALHRLSDYLDDERVKGLFQRAAKLPQYRWSGGVIAKHYLSGPDDRTVIGRMIRDRNVDMDPPDCVRGSNMELEVLAGSHAFGTATEESDKDLIGVCTPPIEVVFPVMQGKIPGFGEQERKFELYDQDDIQFEGESWDVKVFSIVRFFATCMDANPTWLEALFVPEDSVLYSTPVGEHMRENRDLFLHKGAKFRFTGYAASMVNKMNKKDRDDERLYKYGYHAVRLMDEVVEILSEGTLTIGRESDRHTAIRQGKWSFDEINDYVDEKEAEINNLYDNSTAVPYGPDEDAIQSVLVDCLRMSYRRPPEGLFDLLEPE